MYIKEKLAQLGFKTTTPIQDGVFKLFSSKKHLVGLAPTGTGKTHAYLLPMLSKINKEVSQIQAVILVPTNELVNQVLRMLTDVDQEIRVKAYVGSSDKQREVEWLQKYQPQVVITTPKRLYEFVVELNVLKIQHAKYFVMDEADMMFDFDFLSHVDAILSAMPKAKYMLFSATIHESMEPFIKTYFGQYDLIDTSKTEKLNIEYRLINIKYQDRLEALMEVTKHINPYLCFIFVSKKENQEAVFQAISEKGFSVVNLNSSIGVKKRSKIIEDIIDLKYQYVVTSDLAARGLDFKISHVIHFDLPHMLEFFFHRSGRTGRMGDSGIVITFMSVDDHRKIDKIRQKGISFVNYQMTPDGMVKITPKKSAFAEKDIEAIKKIKKPTKVTPNYKKKNKAKIKKAKQGVRREAYAKNR